MHSTYRRKNIVARLIVLLGSFMLIRCSFTESQPTAMSDSASTRTALPEETETLIISPTPHPTLSLLNTWEMETVGGLAWHPMIHVFAFVGWDMSHEHHIHLFDAQTGQELWSKEVIPGGVAFAPNGNFVAVTPFYEAHVQWLEVEDGLEVSSMDADNCSAGDWLIFNTAGDALLTGRGSGHINWETTLNLWDVQSGRCQQLEKRAGFLHFLDVNDDLSLAVISIMMQDQQVYVWDLEEETDVCNFPGGFGLFVPFEDQFVISLPDSRVRTK